MKILGIISSPADPASRARIIQYKEPLAKEGIQLNPHYFTPLKMADPPPWAYTLKKMSGVSEWRSFDFVKSIGRIPLLFQQTGYDLIWQNRLLQIQHYFWEKKLYKPVIFDFDDSIWMYEGQKQVDRKIAISNMIFAGNDYLADYALKYNRNVKIVPSTINTENLFPLGNVINKFIIGWIGSRSNFQYLELIKPVLLDFLSQQKDAVLIIVSSEQPPQFKFDNQKIIFRKWSAEKENELINTFTVGLMPLTDDEWTRGKCSYKLLQYMACGKPFIASPVGTNIDLLSETGLGATSYQQWLDALLLLKNDKATCASMASKGLDLVKEKYSCNTWAPTLLEYFQAVL